MRLTKQRGLLALAFVGVVALAVPMPDASGSEYIPATPEPGTEIPEVSVTFGMETLRG